jgi:superfamily II DNA or RNA helicase
MPNGIYENIECDIGKHPPFTPQQHQEELLDYFINKSKHKGIVAFHRLGSGKSCSSIMISDQMIKLAKIKKVFVMTPGSLRQNFIEEYCEKCGYKEKYLKKYYTFITTNYSVGERLPDFNGGLVIIDEVHNLINGVKNQSKNATLIYNKLMNSKCRILALTGTPVFNYIWEWPFLGNLLNPGTFTKMIRDGNLDKEAFMTKFIIDSDGNVIPKNPKMFSIKLRGIISYFPGVGGGFYPEVIYETPIQVRMTTLQNDTYWSIASWENDIRLMGPPKLSLLHSDPKKYLDKMEEFIMASKYIMSRFYSNFYYPDEYRSSKKPSTKDEIHHIGKVLKYKYKPTGEINETKKYFVDMLYDMELERLKVKGIITTKKTEKEFHKKIVIEVKRQVKKHITTEYVLENIGWIDKSQFTEHKLVDVYSRKMTAIITNIVYNWKAKHVVFTFFKTKAGVNMLHTLFKMCGVKTEIYSGDISDSKRRKILKNFNSEKNRYGDYIKILLVTEAGAEGINLLETQHMHIVESSTREMKIQQAIGRVVRYKSHMVDGRNPMPKKEQVVHIWRYWSVSDPEPFTLKRSFTGKDGVVTKSNKIIVDKTTVDEILYKNGIYSINTMQSFLDLLKKASVTSYDKLQDKNSRLKDYGVIPISPLMEKAYNISDQRYIDNANKISKEISVDIGQVVEDLGYSTDEEKEIGK